MQIRTLISALAFPVLLLSSLASHAAFINFDDLKLPDKHSWSCYIDGESCVKDLQNEYAHLGVVFHGDREFYWGKPDANGVTDITLTGFNGIGIMFTKELPTKVSFIIDSPNRSEASFIGVYDKNQNLLFTQVTSGWNGAEETSTPYIENGLVTIISEEPIYQLDISSFYNRSTGPTIDDLYFGQHEVPEPASSALVGLGLLLLMFRRRTRALRPC